MIFFTNHFLKTIDNENTAEIYPRYLMIVSRSY